MKSSSATSVAVRCNGGVAGARNVFNAVRNLKDEFRQERMQYEVFEVWQAVQQSTSDGEALPEEASGGDEAEGIKSESCNGERWQVLPALWRVSRVKTWQRERESERGEGLTVERRSP